VFINKLATQHNCQSASTRTQIRQKQNKNTQKRNSKQAEQEKQILKQQYK